MKNSSGDVIVKYIRQFDGDTQERLHAIYVIIRNLLPDCEEKISYGVPAFYRNGYIVYFAGYKEFASIYPIRNVSPKLLEELSPYISGKATARFYHHAPLPEQLIHKIVVELDSQHRVHG